MIDEVTRAYCDLPYMSEVQARILARIVAENDVRDVLELGTCHGKGAAYLGAILDDLGRGRVLTLDRAACLDLAPNVHEVVERLALGHRVQVRLHPRSFTMTLLEMLRAGERACFDLVYLDGGHNWDTAGFCFLLTDMLLRPGGLVLFDDLDWTIAGHLRAHPEDAGRFRHHSQDEIEMTQVRPVYELLVPERGYVNLGEPHPGWGLARKPMGRG